MSWIGDESRNMISQVIGWLTAVTMFSFLMWLVEIKRKWKRI